MLALILGVSFSGCNGLAVFTRRPVRYEMLPLLRGVVDAPTGTIRIRFNWMNSALRVSGHRFLQQRQGTRTTYRFTLYGQPVRHRLWLYRHRPDTSIRLIQMADGRYECEVVLVAPGFNKIRDRVVYLDHGQESPIPID